jgi:hypothetical protein
MKLEDIKLGMKVIVVKDRTEEGWVPLLPDIANKFIGKVGRVMGMWLAQQDDDKRGPVIRIYINNGYTEHSFPPSSLEPCISVDWVPDVGDTISFMNGSQQEVGTILQYVEKENGNNKDCHLVVEIKKDDGNIKYAVISSDCVMSKADSNKSVHY